MSSDEKIKTDETNHKYSQIHYLITFIFFFIILINVVILTMSIMSMDVLSSDTNAIKAKNLMITAVSIAYIGEFLILVFLGVGYAYQSNKTKEVTEYYDTLLKSTGGKTINEAMRIVSFSILMFISLVVSALCFEAAKYISESDDPSQYNDQYNTCQKLGEMFLLHFALFTAIQGASYISQLYQNDKETNKKFNNQYNSILN